MSNFLKKYALINPMICIGISVFINASESKPDLPYYFHYYGILFHLKEEKELKHIRENEWCIMGSWNQEEHISIYIDSEDKLYNAKNPLVLKSRDGFKDGHPRKINITSIQGPHDSSMKKLMVPFGDYQLIEKTKLGEGDKEFIKQQGMFDKQTESLYERCTVFFQTLEKDLVVHGPEYYTLKASFTYDIDDANFYKTTTIDLGMYGYQINRIIKNDDLILKIYNQYFWINGIFGIKKPTLVLPETVSIPQTPAKQKSDIISENDLQQVPNAPSSQPDSVTETITSYTPFYKKPENIIFGGITFFMFAIFAYFKLYKNQ